MRGTSADMEMPQESQDNQINIPNFQPFEIDLLLRYIYHPSMYSLLNTIFDRSCETNSPYLGVDAEVARLQVPTQSFLETCVRLWQLGDYYRIETLAMSASEQMRKRTERYIAEAGHVAEMLKGVPFVSEMADAIRAAWDPEKASGLPRGLLLSLYQALTPYLRGYPELIALFDEIPEFASEFGKAVLGRGAVFFSQRLLSPTMCQSCEGIIPLGDAKLREGDAICHSTGTLKVLSDIYCSVGCYRDENTKVKHDHCEICKRKGYL